MLSFNDLANDKLALHLDHILQEHDKVASKDGDLQSPTYHDSMLDSTKLLQFSSLLLC